MLRIAARWTGIAYLGVLLLTASVSAQDGGDVTFTTPFRPGQRPTTANFYYNDRAIGRNREAFEEIIGRIRALPVGTSIVWGPNYARCGACSGSEPPCLPKHLYPDLWKQLEVIVAQRKLILSSAYPTPWIQPTLRSPRGEFPKQIFADPVPANAPFDAVLDWEIGEQSGFVINAPHGAEYAAQRFHRFASNETRLADFDLHLFFGRLPENARVLVRLTLREAVSEKGGNSAKALAADVIEAWESILSRHIRCGGLKTAIVVPGTLFQALQARRPAEHLNIEWQNFHGPNTTHEEVLYLVNDAYVGRGDAGLNQILKRLNQVPPGSTVTLPRYELRGRAVVENLSTEERNTRNATLKDLVPFQHRRHEVTANIASRQLELDSKAISPGLDGETVLNWRSGDRYADTIASFGGIIHYDEQPHPAAARLAWVRYDASNKRQRQLETTAWYTVNDVEVARGSEDLPKQCNNLRCCRKVRTSKSEFACERKARSFVLWFTKDSATSSGPVLNPISGCFAGWWTSPNLGSSRSSGFRMRPIVARTAN